MRSRYVHRPSRRPGKDDWEWIIVLQSHGRARGKFPFQQCSESREGIAMISGECCIASRQNRGPISDDGSPAPAELMPKVVQEQD